MILYHGTSEKNGNSILQDHEISVNHWGETWGTQNRGTNLQKSISITPWLGIAIRYGVQAQQIATGYSSNIPFYVFKINISKERLLPDKEELYDFSRFSNDFDYHENNFNLNESLQQTGSCLVTENIVKPELVGYTLFINDRNDGNDELAPYWLSNKISGIAGKHVPLTSKELKLEEEAGELLSIQNNPWLTI